MQLSGCVRKGSSGRSIRYGLTLTARRASRGQALVESAAATIVITLVFVLLVAFGVNLYTYTVYGSKLQIVANEVAKTVNYRTYWLGAKRPLFQLTDAKKQETKERAQAYAKKLGETLGLPSEPIVSYSDDPDSSVTDVQFTKVDVSLSITRLPFNLGGLFQFGGIQATGIASEQNDAPPAFIRLGFQIPPVASNPSTSSATQVVILPAYGFQTDQIAGGAFGGTNNNKDITGNQPDPTQCVWSSVNGPSGLPLAGKVPIVSGTTPVIK